MLFEMHSFLLKLRKKDSKRENKKMVLGFTTNKKTAKIAV
jgi:hypothetical protein